MDQKSAPLVMQQDASSFAMNPIKVTMRMVMAYEEIPALGWHRVRAAQTRELADHSDGPAARDRHRHFPNLYARAADYGYELQMVEDR